MQKMITVPVSQSFKHLRTAGTPWSRDKNNGSSLMHSKTVGKSQRHVITEAVQQKLREKQTNDANMISKCKYYISMPN